MFYGGDEWSARCPLVATAAFEAAPDAVALKRLAVSMNGPTRASTIDPLLHPRDAAQILGVFISWLAKARLSGDGPRYVKIGRAVRYLESSLREYIKGRTRGSTSEQ
jgi:predicted DNA-binding transcriptional regulator AlpA